MPLRAAVTDPNAIIGVYVPVALGALYCALGAVEVDGLWLTNRPAVRAWTPVAPPVQRGWQTATPPHSGSF